MPWEQAAKEKLGLGREAPNMNPKLTKPTGRLKMSLNPFTVVTQAFGDDLIRTVFCAACCFVFCGAVFTQIPTIMATYLIDRTSPS